MLPGEGDAEKHNLPAPTEPPPPKTRPAFVRLWNEFWGIVRVSPTPDGRKKLAAIADLDADLIAESPAVARFVLAEVKDQAEKKRSAHRTIETKATSIIGFAFSFATVVIGFAAAFDSSVLLKLKWGWFPAIAPSLGFEVIAIIAGIMALRTQSYLLPDAALYNYPDALEEPLNEARIAMALAQTWRKYEAQLDAGNRTRSRRLGVAFWSFVIGVLCTVGLTLGYVSFSTQVPSATIVVNHVKQVHARPLPKRIETRPGSGEAH